MTYEEWHETYMRPFEKIEEGDEPIDSIESGLDGFVLDGILAIKDIDGKAGPTDWDCVEEIRELIELATRVRNKLL